MKIAALLGVTMLLGSGSMTDAQELGIIGRTFENDLPVIFKLVDDLPGETTRANLPWLTVISWSYDGSSKNGMPIESVNESMIRLEQAIENSLLEEGTGHHAYSRTGNGLKELVYYIADRDEFMNALNDVLKEHPPYPIEIDFYNDAQWEDFRKLLEAFRRNG